MAAGMPRRRVPIGSGFAARYEAIYDAAPPRLASMAYDAVALAARLSSFQTDAPSPPNC